VFFLLLLILLQNLNFLDIKLYDSIQYGFINYVTSSCAVFSPLKITGHSMLQLPELKLLSGLKVDCHQFLQSTQAGMNLGCSRNRMSLSSWSLPAKKEGKQQAGGEEIAAQL
jgi:hypothetical protein